MRNLITLSADGKLALRTLNGTETAIAPRKTPNAILLIDTSGSMSGAKIKQAKTGAVDFARSAAKRGYSTGLGIFADRGAVVIDPQPDAEILSRKIANLDVGLVGGGTNLLAGLAVVEKYTDLSAVVVVTDGQVEQPINTLEYAERLKTRGVQIICIGTDDADRTFLRALATGDELAVYVPSRGIGAAIADASRLLTGQKDASRSRGKF
jgi:Mg-chelatase subunit ChlD